MKAILGGIFVLTMGLAICSVAFAGGNQESSGSNSATASSSNLNTSSTYPIVKNPITLTYFASINPARVGATHKSFNELPVFQDLQKLTNIQIKWINPPQGQELQQLNLMISSGDMPDMVYYNWSKYPGGPDKLVSDAVILKLNDLIKQYDPNLENVYKENPDVRKAVTTDSGNLYDYPLIQKDPLLYVNFGFVLRKDWLAKLGLKPPVTIDDWHNVLTAFKNDDPNGDGKKDEIPFESGYNVTYAIQDMISAWGINWDFYVGKDNQAHFGPYEPQYKDYLQTMAQWYKEGLINPDFATTNWDQMTANVTSNLVGASKIGLGDLLTWAKGLGNTDAFVGVPNPVLKAGDKPIVNQRVSPPYHGDGTVLNPKSKYTVEEARWLDYGYSPAGILKYNYGIEGQQYNMVNGKPVLVDSILHNPTMSINVALSQFSMGASSLAFWNDAGVREARQLSLPMQKQASGAWSDQDTSIVWPAAITPTAAESQQLASVMSDVRTFVDERTLAFIMGKADIDTEWNKYIQTLKSLGIEKAIAIQNAGLQPYLSR